MFVEYCYLHIFKMQDLVNLGLRHFGSWKVFRFIIQELDTGDL